MPAFPLRHWRPRIHSACLKGRSVSVEEELAAPRVPVAQALGRVAEQRRREPVEGATLRLEALPAHVDDQSLAAAGRAPVIDLADVLHHRHRGHRRDGLGVRRRSDAERRELDERRPESGLVDDVRRGDRRRRRRSVVVESSTLRPAAVRRILTAQRTSGKNK